MKRSATLLPFSCPHKRTKRPPYYPLFILCIHRIEQRRKTKFRLIFFTGRPVFYVEKQKNDPQKKDTFIKQKAGGRRLFFKTQYAIRKTHLVILLFSFWMTSWAPPSTMEVAETSVSTAFFWNSGMVSAPQLHMVLFTLARLMATLSFKEPA